MPQVLDSGHYEGFEDLVDRANLWLKDRRGGDVVVTNMQSLMVVKDQGLLR